MTPPTTARARTVPSRRIAAGALLALLSAVAPLGGAGAAEEVPLAELRAQRAALVRRIAEVTDTAAAASARLAALDERAQRLELELREARRTLARHAVDTYVDLTDAEPADRLRAAAWSVAAVEPNRQLVAMIRRSDADLLAARVDAESTLASARQAETELRRLRDELEKTIDRREAAAPTGGPTGGRRLPAGVRLTSQRQAELMARYPFGPVGGVPAGLTPTGTVVSGPASWYGPGFDGRPTASGAIFDQEGWTVASRTLPLGTILLVHHGDRSVLTLVNDRGPFVKGRVLDLSKGVARALGTIERGVAPVRAEVLVPSG